MKVHAIFGMALTATLGASIASAQTAPATPKPTADAAPAKPVAEAPPKPFGIQFPPKTFYFRYATAGAEANEIQTTVRNVLPPQEKVFMVPAQNALVVCASADDLLTVQKLLDDLDRPHKSYRLTYTVTEMDGTKRIGVQHFAMFVASGQKTSLKQDSRVPIATGGGSNGFQTQYSFEDVGMDFDATLEVLPSGARLNTLVNDSSFAQDVGDNTSHQPVAVRHMTLEGASFITPGKPLMLGSMDIPGSTRHLDIEVVMEPVP